MKVEQITVFLENESGRLADVATLLAASGVNIRAMALADSPEFGILRLIVNDTDQARRVLKANGFTVEKTEVIGVRVPDRPGGLAEILATVKANQLNVEYLYAVVDKSAADATIIFRFGDLDRAAACLKQAGIELLAGETVYSL